MSLNQLGSSLKYMLPSSVDSVPMSMRSSKDPRPIASSVSTVVVPALTSNQKASGTSIISVPCSSSSGYGTNFYVRLKMKITQTKATADTTWSFKGSSKSATALINSLSTYVNSTQVDNIQNFDQVADIALSHSTSKSWLDNDGSILLGTNTDNTVAKDSVGPIYRDVCIPLLGLLGSSQSLPLFAISGQLQINLNYNTIARAFYVAQQGAPLADVVSFTDLDIERCELVYTRVQVEQSFIDQVRSEMQMGQAYVYAFTNYQCSSQLTQAGSNNSFQYGLNVSSLRGIVANQVLNADYSKVSNKGLSLLNGLSQFVVLLDGRQVSNVILDNAAQQFAEMNKVFNKLYDASISDNCNITTYTTNAFAVGQDCTRTNEALAFAGSPVSIVNVNFSCTDSAYSMNFVFIADKQLLIMGDGSVQLVQ
jgi:hypothetical protein